MALQNAIGEIIQRLRKEQGISQEKLSLEAGIDRKYMSDIENGKRNVSVDILERLSKYFDLSASELLFMAEGVDRPEKTLADIKEELCDRGYEDAVLFETPDYLSAIIGVSEDGRVVYSYDKMVAWLINQESMTEEDALYFISYNTIRALPHMGKKAPIIMYNVENK